MSYADFVHLRVHTAYSLAEGAIHVADLLKQCIRYKMPAVGVTDRNNMFAALEFSVKAAEAGVQPLIGATISVYDDADPSQATDRRVPSFVPLLAQTEKGYRNLLKIVSKSHLDPASPHSAGLTLAQLKGITDGIICLSGGADGPLGHSFLAGDQARARENLEILQAYFGDRFYIELQRHGLENEQKTEEYFLDIAYEKNIPIVATNTPYFGERDMYEAHDTLLCIADSTYVAASDRRKLNPEFYFKSPDEMSKLFSDLPEAIENTLAVARRCHIAAKEISPLLPNFTKGEGISESEKLRQMAMDGLKDRLDFLENQQDGAYDFRPGWRDVYRDRLTHELDIIVDMKFPGYFLIVADFIQWAKDHDIPVGPGRGSGAGSVVAWALLITDLDPLRFSLLFERFLNPERVSMPDFDIDFCQERREEVIRYVQEKYGDDRVAQIITFGKLQARAVVKACGRVLQQPYPVTDRLSKLIPNDPGKNVSLQEALDSEPRLREERNSEDLTKTVIDRALKLEGLYAHSSTHAAGVVIGDRPLDELVPLYRDPKSDMPVTQFNMKWVENAGLVKFDFLGLKTLTVLQWAVNFVRKRGINLDLIKIPLDDKPTYKLLAAGDASGVFQLESSGMRSVLKGLKPDVFEDIIAIVALYRPGPMENIPLYIERKHGRVPIDYPHPTLKTILKETNGIIVYQEQVMQIAQEMAGYSLGQADLLRRAMGKKIHEEMVKQRDIFEKGAIDRGVSKKKASEIFDLVMKFASYGFNKSHAAAYALLAYQTAYMKANFPVEFMAAIMALDEHNTDKLGVFRQELKRMEIPLLLPDINKSEIHFSVEKTDLSAISVDAFDPDNVKAGLSIRYALAAIKGVGEKAMEAIIDERSRNGPFKDMSDFAYRIDPSLLNKRQLEHLAAAGAFEHLVPDRSTAYRMAEVVLKTANRTVNEKNSRQESLFGGSSEQDQRLDIPVGPVWTPSEALVYEKQAVGFYLSSHPLDGYQDLLKRENITEAKTVLAGAASKSVVKMAGSITDYREITARKSGKKFGALSLSDQTDSFEVLIFDDDLTKIRQLVSIAEPVMLTVEIRQKDGDDKIGLSSNHVMPLSELAAQSGTGLVIDLSEINSLKTVKAVLDNASKGKGKIRIRVPILNVSYWAEIELAGRCGVTPEMIQALKTDKGILAIEEV